jgi:putative component of toxin-antitoxin plasmid stabilization module
MSIRVEEYIRPDGANPYKTWFDSLDPQAAAKVVTGGGMKRRQQADIDRAVVLHAEYKSRKAPKAAANKAEKRKR